TVITGYSEMLLKSPVVEEQARASLTEIHNAAQRAGALTRQLLTFSRKQPTEWEIVNLNTIVMDFEKMLRRLIGEDIDVSIKLDSNLAFIRGDVGQLEQVLMNLAVNARDAMPDGGRLTITTANTSLDSLTQRRYPEAPAGNYVLL